MNKLLKKVLFYLLLTLFSVITLAFFCDYYIRSQSADFLYSEVDKLPKRNIGLLLGTSPYLSNGSKNPYFEYRILAAANLFRQGKINFIIASGDNRTVNYNEPVKMRQALMKLGVPKEAIYLDYAGFSTYESVIRCKKVFCQDTITIISQDFHNERAVYIAKSLDMDAIAFNAQNVSEEFHRKVVLREFFARTKAIIDLHLIPRKPKYLGQPIMIGGITQP